MVKPLSPERVNHWLRILQDLAPFKGLNPDHLHDVIMSGREISLPASDSLAGSEDQIPSGFFCFSEGDVTRPPSAWLCLPVDSLRPLPDGQDRVAPGHDQGEAGAIGKNASLSPPHFDRPLRDLVPKSLVFVSEQTLIRQALEAMQASHVGSVLIKDQEGRLSGILTRHDLLDRVVLKEIPLDTPVLRVMSHPVHCVDSEMSIAEAAVVMSRLEIRHLPVTKEGQVINIVSERELFALQQQSPRHVHSRLQLAENLPQLCEAAQAIRELAMQLADQGVQSRWLTELISGLNDKLTCKLIEQQLSRSGLDPRKMCWIALGSEGRGEQTIATDQDNALMFESEQPDVDRPRWMAFAQKVNQGLADCGFPLCQGGVMASNSDWCRTPQEWMMQCRSWIEHGAPSDLLKAAVFFDLRPLLGQMKWPERVRDAILAEVKAKPRFLQQWVRNHLGTGVALNWHGGLSARHVEGRDSIDLKLSGTAILVDAARILALSQGVRATGTVHRLHESGQRLGVPEVEYQGWITAFEFLQQLRLRQQIRTGVDSASANQVAIDGLNLLDRQMLKAAFRTIRSLQQRLEMDYLR